MKLQECAYVQRSVMKMIVVSANLNLVYLYLLFHL